MYVPRRPCNRGASSAGEEALPVRNPPLKVLSVAALGIVCGCRSPEIRSAQGDGATGGGPDAFGFPGPVLDGASFTPPRTDGLPGPALVDAGSCGTESAMAMRVPVDIALVVDISSSMANI